MRLTLVKSRPRRRMICERTHGPAEIIDLGPDLPAHDLAHYVAERRLGLSRGFYGNLDRGYTAAELADKRVIQQLPPESMVAEVAARAVQALADPACTAAEWRAMVATELRHHGIDLLPSLDLFDVESAGREYRALLSRWATLPEGGKLVLPDFVP